MQSSSMVSKVYFLPCRVIGTYTCFLVFASSIHFFISSGSSRMLASPPNRSSSSCQAASNDSRLRDCGRAAILNNSMQRFDEVDVGTMSDRWDLSEEEKEEICGRNRPRRATFTRQTKAPRMQPATKFSSRLRTGVRFHFFTKPSRRYSVRMFGFVAGQHESGDGQRG